MNVKERLKNLPVLQKRFAMPVPIDAMEIVGNVDAMLVLQRIIERYLVMVAINFLGSN